MKSPDSLDADSRLKLVSALTRPTFAPGIAPPDESFTEPTIVPETICAESEKAPQAEQRSSLRQRSLSMSSGYHRFMLMAPSQTARHPKAPLATTWSRPSQRLPS